MIRFLGNIEARADAKGRVFIPATFRKQLQAASEERLIMRKDVFQDCLTLYPESVWNEELNELRSRLNKWNNKHQLIFRQFVSDVEVVTPDSNGRILIPKRYLQICSIAVLYIWKLTKWHVVAIATNTFSSTVTRRPTP